MNRRLRSMLVSGIVSAPATSFRRAVHAAPRVLRRRRPVIAAYLQLDDPWSWLLAQALPAVAKHYDAAIEWHLCEAAGGAFQPQPDMHAEYALADARLLAAALGVPFLDRGPTPLVEMRRALLRALAADADSPHFGDMLVRALAAYWRGDAEGAHRQADGVDEDDGAADALLERGNASRDARGHYNSAMLYFEGEWYWGIDRLHYLCARLDTLRHLDASARPPELAPPDEAGSTGSGLAALPFDAPINVFFSFRSPYSYIALARLEQVAAERPAALHLRPVLPMLTRGLPVPRAKLRYIVLDAAREARRHGIPLGRFYDPLGPGVERCVAVMSYAETAGRGLAFAAAAARAIWAGGRALTSDRGLRPVVEAAGLDWAGARDALESDGWRALAEHNRLSMAERGIWGVPAFTIGPHALWGQDRLWLLAHLLHTE